MPAPSKASYRFWEFMKHNPKARSRKWISLKTVNEFLRGVDYSGLPERSSKKVMKRAAQKLRGGK